MDMAQHWRLQLLHPNKQIIVMAAAFKTVQTLAITTEIGDNTPSQIGHLLFDSLGFHETIKIAQFFSAMV
jgi:hypothetical protein